MNNIEVSTTQLKEIIVELHNLCCCQHLINDEKCIYCRSKTMIKICSDWERRVKQEENKALWDNHNAEHDHPVHCVDCAGLVKFKRQENRCGICWMKI